MISAGQASAWPKFAHILGHDEWIDIPEFQRVEDRVKNRVLLDPMIAEETSKFEKNVLLERLAEAKIAAAPVMTVADVANAPLSGMSEACTQRSPTPSWVLSGSRIRPSRCRRRPLCEGPRSPAGRAQR